MQQEQQNNHRLSMKPRLAFKELPVALHLLDAYMWTEYTQDSRKLLPVWLDVAPAGRIGEQQNMEGSTMQ